MEAAMKQYAEKSMQHIKQLPLLPTA